VHLLGQVALHIAPASYAPNELIVKPGDPALHMYTIKRGLVASPGAVVGAGMHFGDDFLLTSFYRPYTVRALTFLDCFTLSNTSLYGLFQYGQYPIFQVKSSQLDVLELSMPSTCTNSCSFHSLTALG
jgi:hypothetical protein